MVYRWKEKQNISYNSYKWAYDLKSSGYEIKYWLCSQVI